MKRGYPHGRMQTKISEVQQQLGTDRNLGIFSSFGKKMVGEWRLEGRKASALAVSAPFYHWQLKPALALRKLCSLMGGFEGCSSSKILFRGFKIDW